MIYLGNGMYSDSSLSHGGPWKEHKYIRIENGRYIYPSDIKGGLQRSAPPPEIKYKEGRNRHRYRKQDKKLQYVDKYQNSVNEQGPSAAERAQTYAYNPYYKDTMNNAWISGSDPFGEGRVRNSKNVDTGESHESSFKKYINNEKQYYDAFYPEMSKPEKNALSVLNAATNVVLDARDKGIDKAEDKIEELKGKKKYGKLYNTVKVTKPSKAQDAQSDHNYSSSDRSRNVSGMPKYGRPDDSWYRQHVNLQGPSAAEKAQRNAVGKRSRNTDLGSKNVNYKKTKDINKNKKYQKSVSSQGPSAAERAQTTRYYSSKINGKWDTPPEAESNNIHGTTRQRMVSYNNKPKGPSAAEMAQRNANGGSRNVEKKPKKKKSVKSAVKSWVKKNIIGAPGKVTTHN